MLEIISITIFFTILVVLAKTFTNIFIRDPYVSTTYYRLSPEEKQELLKKEIIRRANKGPELKSQPELHVQSMMDCDLVRTLKDIEKGFQVKNEAALEIQILADQFQGEEKKKE